MTSYFVLKTVDFPNPARLVEITDDKGLVISDENGNRISMTPMQARDMWKHMQDCYVLGDKK